ncbi:MAG TPA: HAD-IA family hydrolase [Candidatus Baltobacteraceae bacterium]|jgi:phosphoglycolate phosphatase|nr:HAD-IA family hydrolase [Candidatus Baltobacteraceae bacterium]
MNGNGSANDGRRRFAGVRALFFDLDGTLIDSKLDLAISVNATRRHMGLDPLADETIFGYVGNGAQALVQRALGEGVTPEQIEQGHKFFLAYYRAHMLDNTVAYPGVREGLELLKDHDLAVLTNKPARFSEAILAGLGLASYFRYVYGGNSFATKKPDPEGVNTLLRNFGATPQEAMMVGDSEVDVRTARNSGMWACGVSYGLGFDGMRACPPDLMLDSLAELPKHLDGIGTPERPA